MCLGSQPQAPQIQYSGPSEDDIRRNEQALATYQQQMSDQQSAFQSQLQAQIDAANAETASLEKRYANDLTKARSAGDQSIADAKAAGAAQTSAAGQNAAAQQASALTVTTQQSEPEMPQTTQSTAKRNKKPKSLKISTAGIANALGSGVNLGI